VCACLGETHEASTIDITAAQIEMLHLCLVQIGSGTPSIRDMMAGG